MRETSRFLSITQGDKNMENMENVETEETKINSIYDLRQNLDNKLSDFWEKNKVRVGYKSPYPSGVVKLDNTQTIIIRKAKLGYLFSHITPEFFEGVILGYVCEFRNTYILIKKDVVGQHSPESLRNHKFKTEAAFWQQYNALDNSNFKVKLRPNVDENKIEILGTANKLETLRQWLNGELKSDSRQTMCNFLGRHNLPREAIQTTSSNFTDRNSVMIYEPHNQLHTVLSVAYYLRGNVELKIVVAHPSDPRGDIVTNRRLAGSTFRAKLEEIDESMESLELFIANESWNVIEGSQKIGDMHLALPENLRGRAEDEQEEEDTFIDDFEQA